MPRTAIFLVLTLVAGCGSRPPRNVVVRAGRLVDGSGAPAQENVIIRVADGEIVAIEPDAGDAVEFGGATAVIDARDLTILPGLVNGHTHLFSGGACTVGTGAGVRQAVRNLHAFMRGGVTTVADLGAPAALAVALRRYVGTARGRGPRVMVSGPFITAPGGSSVRWLGPEMAEIGKPVEISSVFEARTTVREIADADVDQINVGLEDDSDEGSPQPVLEGDVLCAVVDEAHKQEMRVVAYATTVRSYFAALDCGADVIASGSREPLPEDLIARLAESGVLVAPTQFVFEAPLWGASHVGMLGAPGIQELLPAETIEDLGDYAARDARAGRHLPPPVRQGSDRAPAEAIVAVLRDNTRHMFEAGVSLGLGTGAASCFQPAGSPIRDLERLEAAGIGRLDILKIATEGGARLLDLQDAIGTVAVGYRADLVGVRGEPDRRLADIERVELVMIDGVRQELEEPTLGEHLAAGMRVGWAWLTD